MFGPDRTATGRPRTSVERRRPLGGSRPFVRLSTGAVPGSEPRVVDVEPEARRPRPHLRAVEEVEALAVPRWRLASLAQLAERTVELRGRDARRVALEQALDLVQQAADPAPGLRRDGDQRRALAEAPLELRPDVLDAHLGHVPFRQDDERRAICLPGRVG